VSAAEDYPRLAWIAQWDAVDGIEARYALKELDALRSDVANLLTMCSEAGIEWPDARFALGGGSPGQDVAS
jgi:hypothetical protein